MKKSFMNNIKHFVDSNVRQRIDRVANNNNEFFGDDLLLVERQFEDLRYVLVQAEKRISALLQSINTSTLGTYTHNVQASLNLSGTLVGPAQIPNSAANSTQQQYNEPTQPTSTQPNSSGSMFKSTIQSAYQPSSELSIHSNIKQQPAQANCKTMVSDSNADSLRNDMRMHKKLPIVGFLKFLVKSCVKLKADSILAKTLTHCSQLQTQLTKLYLSYEQTVELQCLKPIQQILEHDVPNVIKLRKLFIKSHNDLESTRAKYNGANQKQQHQQLQAGHFTSSSYTVTQTSAQQAHVNKLDHLRKELDDAVTRSEQAKDAYAAELYAFVCRETELVSLLMKFYQYQADYQQKVADTMQSSLPSLSNLLANSPRKVVFGTPLNEHLRCTGRSVSLVIELCIHLLYSNGLAEEGIFRIPGSSVKIRKLKNAMNAWFVTLASQDELEEDQANPCNNFSLLAIHDLFKDIVGQRQAVTAADSINSQSIAPTSTKEQSNSAANTNSPDSNQHLVYDVHTIAGLLKLYLRELPEPLFTYDLYDQWIEATVKTLNNERPTALEQVVKLLPKANYDNLSHLIRFLHLLTCHCELNKMTATNLAITMAPSLIWARPVGLSQHDQPLNKERQYDDELQSLNSQLSNIGISTSLHALVIENLINQAETLFPGSIDFTIADLSETRVTLYGNKHRPLKKSTRGKQERSMKSTSPTGLSTASSSSFSSGSNGSAQSSGSKNQNRKVESVVGFFQGDDNNVTIEKSSNPKSVHGHEAKQSNPMQQQQPPPIPPAPVARSHLRQSSDSTTTNRPIKPPAPPLPLASKRNPKVSAIERHSSHGSNPVNTSSSPRGAGAIIGNLNAARPSVPPPNRPSRLPCESASQNVSDQCPGSKSSDVSPNGDNGSSHSIASSGNLRTESEEVSVNDVDDIDINVSNSPIVSLDSISGEDSSFENEANYSDHPWQDYDSERDNNKSKSTNEKVGIVNSAVESRGSYEAQNVRVAPKPFERTARKQRIVLEDTVPLESTPEKPPIKPPRSASPKIAQSTPL